MKHLLTSREFWTAVLTIFVLIMGQVFPSFHLDVAAASALVVLAVSYMVGVVVDPGPGGWVGTLKSRKFWAAAIGFILIILNGFGIVLPDGLTVESIVTIVVTLAGLIVSIFVSPPPASAS